MSETELEFISLHPQNWEQWKSYVIADEAQYPESLQTSEEEYARMISDLPAISMVVLYDKQYAGNCMVKRLAADDWVDLHMDDLDLPEGLYSSCFYGIIEGGIWFKMLP